MMNELIVEKLRSYIIQDINDEMNALKEILLRG